MTLSPPDITMTRGPATMVDVEHAIDLHRVALTQHPFLVRLEGKGDSEQFRRLLCRLGVFPLVFQDILRLARERCSNPKALAIAIGLELGDRGHDQWYLDDLECLKIPLDIRLMFSAEHALVRRVTYELVSRVLTVSDDCSRLSVLLSIEAIAREFFKRIITYAKGLGIAHELKYFGRIHLEAEEIHEVFSEDGGNQLAAIVIPEQAVQEVLSTIEHTFEAMARLADDLEAAMSGVADDAHLHEGRRGDSGRGRS